MEFIEIAGIKWATCNVGANKPTDVGLYFQWGDRKGYTADEVGEIKVFDWLHYKHHNGKRLTKYNELDKKQVLDLRDDAAFSYMGQGWRMPTREDFRRLVNNTTQRWTKNYQGNGVAGMVFIDITDNTKELFFPAAGKCLGDEVYFVDQVGYYFSCSLYSRDTSHSCYLYFNRASGYWDGFSSRSVGYPVRGILTT